MSLKDIMGVTVVILAIGQSALGGSPAPEQGRNIFVETGVTQPDREATFYAPMVAMPYAPVFEILATRGTQGRYYDYTYAVTLKDIVKWHGHDCEGLTHAACCCKMALDMLFPDGVVDRSVLRGISGRSPCWSDTVAFLSGARTQYGNLAFFKEKQYDHAIVLYREDTQVAVLATMKNGLNTNPGESSVLPESIQWKPSVSPQEIIELKKAVKAAGGKPTPYQVDKMRYQQWKLINEVLSRPLAESYQAKVIEGFRWDDWVDPNLALAAPVERTDVRLKNYPYRSAPVEEPTSQPGSNAASPQPLPASDGGQAAGQFKGKDIRP